MAERDIQKQILDWLKENGIWHRRIPLGAPRHAGVKKKNPMRGMPDIMFARPGSNGQMGFIEVKDLKGKLSDIQEEVIWELEQEDFLVIIAHSLDDVIPYIKIKTFVSEVI